ncbi:MAG: oxidoreductase [Bacteroidales bacterium]|nr:oxidoreductase [Bacteroidales bacterium]
MKTALVSGATGLVGSFLVKMLLEDGYYDKVKIIVRKPVDLNHPSLEQIIYDYENPEPEKFEADDVFCCLGTTIKKAGSKEAFIKVDYEYPLQVAQATQKAGARNFSIITAIGASSKSKIFYSRVKGEVEEKLQEIPFHSLQIFRPSMLLGPRKEFRTGEEIGKIFARMLWFLFPKRYRGIHVSQVAGCMISKIKEAKPGLQIIESDQMHEWPVRKNP